MAIISSILDWLFSFHPFLCIRGFTVKYVYSKYKIAFENCHSSASFRQSLFRSLLYGMIRSIRPLGPLDGLLGGRFILAFLSVLCILGAKGVFIGTVVISYYDVEVSLSLSTSILLVGLQFVPQLILATFTVIGFSWSSIKLIPYHPEILLLSSGKHLIKRDFKISCHFFSSNLLYGRKS